MPCGCAGSAQRVGQRKSARAALAPVTTPTDSRVIGDASYFWNGPRRASTPNKQHTRRQG